MKAAPFQRFVIVRNPVSTNALAANRRISELRRAFPDVEFLTVETLPGGREANAGLLRPYADKLGEQTLLCIAGGDGTINMVLESILNDPKLSAKARQTPVLPLWGGNANDLAHMLNGRGRKASLPHLIRSGTVVKVFPLICSLTDTRGKTALRVAACYASFGASAITTRVLNNQTARSQVLLSRIPPLRIAGEILVVIPAMSQAPTFAASEDGRRKTVYEYAFFNGPRFAKVSGVKRRLTDQTFHRILVERKRLSDILGSIAILIRPRKAGKFETTHVAFTALEATWAQFDGEAQHVYAGTHIAIDIGTQPFYVLSTRIPETTLD